MKRKQISIRLSEDTITKINIAAASTQEEFNKNGIKAKIGKADVIEAAVEHFFNEWFPDIEVENGGIFV